MKIKRRQAIGSLVSLPALTALPAMAQQNAPVKPSGDEFPKLETTHPEAVTAPAPRFFTPPQMATLRKLSLLLLPAANNRPGAIEANAPEFLDFLLQQSPAARQDLYRQGLDSLENEAHGHFGRSFDALSDAESATLLTPLHSAPASTGPSRFLHAAKEDILRATMNSRQFAAASGGRRGTGMGTYWLPIE